MKFSSVLVALMAGTALATKTVTRTVTHTAPGKKTTLTKTLRTTVHDTTTATLSNTVTDTLTDTITATVTNTTTTTATVTTTYTPNPTYTSFIGTGNMVVYAEGSHNGHVSKYGGWYLSSSPATYTGISMASDNSMFTLTTSLGPCEVLGSGAFNCSMGNTNTVFGQTADGNLTYVGSDIFGAASGPTTNAPGSVIQDGAGAFELMIKWDPVNND